MDLVNGNGTWHPTTDYATSSFDVRVEPPVAIVGFSKGQRHNPFSSSRIQALEGIIKELNNNPEVTCLILTGGDGSSFSAGGDFHETMSFAGGKEIDDWIDTFTKLYSTILGISKPVIAAIDGHAVGLGLQIALCCDYRIGSKSCRLSMPEFRMGIACNFGGFLLESIAGRAVMQKMLFTSSQFDAPTALQDGLLHEIVDHGKVVARAIEQASCISSWPTSGIQVTRPHINAALIGGLTALGEQAKESHRRAFSTGEAQTLMKQLVTKRPKEKPSWLLIASKPIKSLAKALQKIVGGDIHVYGHGSALYSDMFLWRDEIEDTQTPLDWDTKIVVRSDKVYIRTGVMNVPPLYLVHDTSTRSWALGTDPFMLNVARSQWDMPVDLVAPGIIHRDGTTSFLGVQQLPSPSYMELNRDTNSWTSNIQQSQDPILSVFNPTLNDFYQAGTTFVESLRLAVSDMTKGEHSIATLLSGGIDSGAVTTFAVMAGLKVVAYSVGSPWGNEHDDARELTDHLGIRHVRVDFSAEELLAAVPETIRAIGMAERDRVDIVLTVTALMRSSIIKEKHILTGYGSDLLNLGLPPESEDVAALQQHIFDGIDCTRHSGEFTDTIVCTHDKKISHPYWHKAVVETALSIHPSSKIQGGREKAFFRKAMEPYVPYSSAWRKKIGIHLGGGLQGGLDGLFGGAERKQEAYCDILRVVSNQLLKSPVSTIEELSLQKDNSVEVMNGHPQDGLTPSGAGIVMDANDLPNDLKELATAINSKIKTSQALLIKNLALDEDRFKTLVRAIGEPIVHRYQSGGSDLMKLNGTNEKGKVVLGRGPLPLHTDGLLLGHHPDTIILYASECSNSAGSGETFIVDQLRALQEMPEPLLTALSEAVFEYQIQESGHYGGKEVDNQWLSIPPIRKSNGNTSMRVAMPFPPDVEKSWNIRVAGASTEDSDRLIADVQSFFNQPRYRYQHHWEAGDFLVFENTSILHGRTAITEGGVRVLFRGQVNRRSDYVQ